MSITLLPGDCRDVLPTLAANSVHTCVTSPPYFGLRDYGTAQWDGGDAECGHTAAATGPTQNKGNNGHNGAPYRDICGKCGARRVDRQIGLEATPDEYLAQMVAVFREVRRVLRPDGTLWLNMSGGYQNKQLDMMPARLALALQANDWVLRSDIIWHKPGPMPESVRDRPTSAHEHIFLLSKSRRYYFDLEAIRTPNGANCRNVWTIASYPFSEWTETSRQVRVAPDAPGDGKKRITSPDCPVHGDRAGPVSSVPDDAHAAGSSSHTSHTDADHAQAPAADCAPTATPREPATDPSMLDLLAQSYFDVATLRSNQSHRTDRAPATSLPYNASAQTGDGIECTSASQQPFGSAERTPESSSALDGLGGGRSSQTVLHNVDKFHGSLASSSASTQPHCTCEWYIEKTAKTSHFATFPSALAERCIRAGTSERGCCAACGAPWRRATDTSYERNRHGHSGCTDASGSNGWDGGAYPNLRKISTTTGWSPSCACAADVVPATVLDCFAGAGTTLLVADRLQRNAIGIELNADYTRMAMERCRADAPLFMAEASVESAPHGFAQPDLFAEAAD